MAKASKAFVCQACGAVTTRWSGKCAACGEWNSIVVDFQEERPIEELGISTAPVYTAESGEG